MRYQNAMIDHFRRTGARNAKSAFDAWQTSLANEAARKQALIPTTQFCHQATETLKLASTLDTKGFHEYVVAHSVNGAHPDVRNSSTARRRAEPEATNAMPVGGEPAWRSGTIR